MTKAELVEKMAKDAGISKVAAAKALGSFIDGVKKALKKERQENHSGWFWHVCEGAS